MPLQTHHDRVLGIAVKQGRKRQKISNASMNFIPFMSVFFHFFFFPNPEIKNPDSLLPLP